MITYKAKNKDGDIVSLTVQNERQAVIYCSFLDVSKTVGQDWLRLQTATSPLLAS